MKIYEVGGCVRDTLMGVTPKDYDYVVVGSTPDEMISLGYQKVGAAFPVFLHPENNNEYALARTERKVGNGYNGFECVFSPDVTLEEDLSRRDLTCNSIAKCIKTGEIIDPFGGQKDIEIGVLRHVSNAFMDDPLRVIRLARFYARLEFSIDLETLKIVTNLVDSGEMNHITDERYWAELMKVFSDENCDIAKFFSALRNFGVLSKTKYFNALLGDFGQTDIHPDFAKKCEKIRTDIVSNELKAALFVALFEKSALMNVKAIPSRVTTLVKNFRNVNSSDFKQVNDVYGLISATRAFNETTVSLMDVASCMRFGCMRNESRLLTRSASECHSIKSDPYKHLSGVEIGAAMKTERLAAIQIVLNNGTKVKTKSPW